LTFATTGIRWNFPVVTYEKKINNLIFVPLVLELVMNTAFRLQPKDTEWKILYRAAISGNQNERCATARLGSGRGCFQRGRGMAANQGCRRAN
jgi:hypothetical protein